MIPIKSVTITTQGAIPLGRQGEHNAREIIFPQPEELLAENWTLLHRRARDREAYPVPLEKRDGNLVWLVTGGDTGIPGSGQAELTCIDGSGADGKDGAQGPKGDTGPQGPKGDKGEQGSQGPRGPKGDSGEDAPAPVIFHVDTDTMTIDATASDMDSAMMDGLVYIEIDSGYYAVAWCFWLSDGRLEVGVMNPIDLFSPMRFYLE